ncbi:hypothetical protein JM66_03115 [Aeromonas bestiarum]|nr:hypothetical protein JM66_03115 [Aeromonas bestiarum]
MYHTKPLMTHITFQRTGAIVMSVNTIKGGMQYESNALKNRLNLVLCQQERILPRECGLSQTP